MRGRRASLAGFMAAAVCLVGPGVAQADHHLVRIAEVWPGFLGDEEFEYLELEMISAGQNLFAGKNATVTLYASDGSVNHTEPLDADVDNGQRGRRVLVGSDQLEVKLATVNSAPDFEYTAEDHVGESGAACFTAGLGFGTVDCVSWGTYTGPALPSATGGPADAIPAASALQRDRPTCGPGLIDTNSPSDWTVSLAFDAENNAAPATTGDPCPQTTITKKPRKKTTKRRATFKFTATQGVTSFKCKLDDGPFRNCSSPFRKNVGIGKHTFKVKAAGDPSPASYSWKRIRG